MEELLKHTAFLTKADEKERRIAAKGKRTHADFHWTVIKECLAFCH